ncbi:MAG TPA: hypothetical protein VHO25_04475, partial [Polyangiaceae bacterium]|nr:hypothetical protein [Polyangiaceae bacterium]
MTVNPQVLRVAGGRVVAAAAGAFPVAALTLVTEAIRLHQAKLSWLECLAIAGSSAFAIGLIGSIWGAIVVVLAEWALPRVRWTWP